MGMHQILHAAELSASFTKFQKCHCTLWHILAAPAVDERPVSTLDYFPWGREDSRMGSWNWRCEHSRRTKRKS